MGITVTNLKQFWTVRRLTAASLLGKMAGLVLSAVLLPINGLVIETAVAQDGTISAIDVPTLVLATDSIDTMFTVSSRPELTITVVESKAEERARVEREMAQQQLTQQALSNEATDVPFEQKRALAQAAASAYGIDWKIVEAVWQVESGKRWKTAVRSYAGAQGPMQFMPGTWRAYQVDGNGDGVVDVNDARDAVYAGANYLAANGAATSIDNALFRYNHAQWYVDKVKTIAASIAS